LGVGDRAQQGEKNGDGAQPLVSGDQNMVGHGRKNRVVRLKMVYLGYRMFF